MQMDPSTALNVAFGQITASAVLAYAIEALKKSKYFPWLTKETEKLNRIVAIVLSGATAIGVHASFDHDAGVLIITGLGLASLKHGIWAWAQSYVATKVVYDTAIKPRLAAPVINQPNENKEK